MESDFPRRLELVYHSPLSLLISKVKCFVNMNNRSHTSDNDNIGYGFTYDENQIEYMNTAIPFYRLLIINSLTDRSQIRICEYLN